MLQESPNFPDAATSLIADIEKSPVQRVIGSEIWAMPVWECTVELKIAKPIPLSIIDEYVISLIVEFPDEHTVGSLAELLSLDTIFVEASLTNLLEMEAIESADTCRPTDIGVKLYKERRSLKDLRQENLQFFRCPHFGSFDVHPDDSQSLPLFGHLDTLPVFQFESKLDGASLATILARCDRRILNEELGEEVVSATVSVTSEARHSSHVLLWVSDAIEDTVFPRIFCLGGNGHQPILRRDFSELFSDLFEPPKLSLVEREHFDDVHTSAANQKYRNILKQSAEPASAKIRLLRSAEIRTFFHKMIRQARRSMIVISPWISDSVVDSQLLELLRQAANKGCAILIGWGFRQNILDEERKPSQELLKALNSIKDPSGLPAILVQWLGHTHNKEVIVDNRFHLLGSYNWLSYRGDYKIRGESVYYVDSKEDAAIAANGIEQQFAPLLLANLTSSGFFLSIASLRFLLSLNSEQPDVSDGIGTHLKSLSNQSRHAELEIMLRVHSHLNKLRPELIELFATLLHIDSLHDRIRTHLHYLETRRNQFFTRLSRQVGDGLEKTGYTQEFRRRMKKTKTSLDFHLPEKQDGKAPPP